MLGSILGGLTNAATAEAVAANVADTAIMQRIRTAAGTQRVPVGAFVASKVRHVIENAGEAIWLDLIGAMSGSPQPGAAAIERVLAHAFPDPVRVRITRAAQ